MTYAYWRKCDFQIHTPRDPNWTGDRPIGIGEIIDTTAGAATAVDVDAARLEWAREFVNQCVAKGLEVVALTDHHEMVMVPYVQQLIVERNETDPDFNLWLLPGMELTVRGGKQCLILFDADLSEEWRQQVQSKLGIAYADQDDKAAQSLKVTPLKISYPDIAKELDGFEALRGRYIVLPNVSQGNSHTVLVEGAHEDFRRMPYVGGYLDQGQTIDNLSPKNRKRLSGRDRNWSVREIYPLPTTDSRSADYSTLGQNNTWIKLAEPTAEAIRQAFLAHPSRICVGRPQTPSLVVAELSIAGSAILQDTDLPLSPELNAAIGGRGSGKSTLLEYLSFGLGRSCYDMRRERYSGTQRLSELVTETLLSENGHVKLKIIQDNAAFEVERRPASHYQPQVTYPNGNTQTITVKELRSLFPAVVYSQGELAEIGKQTGKNAQLSELLQFVNPDYRREDDGLTQGIETKKDAVKEAIQRLTTHWRLQATQRQLKANHDSLAQRVRALEETLPKQSEEDQAIVNYFEKVTAFDSKRIQASKHADQILSDLGSAAAELLNERDLESELTNNIDADSIRHTYSDLYKSLSTGIKELQEELKFKRDALTSAETNWAEQLKKARAARDAVLEKFSEHRTVTEQIVKLREQLADITHQIGDLQSKLEGAGDPADSLRAAITALHDINRHRAERTQVWANEIQELSSGSIKATVDSNGDVSEIIDALEVVASKTGSQEATRRKGCEEAFSREGAAGVLDRLRQDCLSLLQWRQVGSASGEDQPECDELMKILGDTEKIRASLTEHLDTMRVEAISTAVPKPNIKLSYCDGERQIAFEKASEGQRAAALLFMLMEQAAGPLIVDQPEGDLDNRIITDLTDKLHGSKQNRQLVFASHNANIVVNGSSELVAYLDIEDTGKRKIASAGAIDKREISSVITSTMEGGEKAFKDRQDKYGY